MYGKREERKGNRERSENGRSEEQDRRDRKMFMKIFRRMKNKGGKGMEMHKGERAGKAIHLKEKGRSPGKESAKGDEKKVEGYKLTRG